MRIRPETQADHDAIGRVTTAAFATTAHASGQEARIVEALRAAGALRLSLVTECEGAVAGHVALSPVTLDDGTPGWFGLGPVSVDPDRQGRGIGAALVRAALDRLPALGAAGCVVLGDPAYYTRFGFRHHPALRYPQAPAEYFMALGDAVPAATVAYHPAFHLPDPASA